MDSSDKEVLNTCIDWLNNGHKVNLVTVARTWGSSPRPLGSLAAVREDGVLVGSVSGGCVEKQLVEKFGHADASNSKPTEVLSHRIDDEQARRYGLACGGQLELVFETLSDPENLQLVLNKLDRRQRVVKQVSVGSTTATYRDAQPDDAFAFDGTQLQTVFGPQWRVIIIGAGQLSRFVASFAGAVDFDIVVCDPRPGFEPAWLENDALFLPVEPHKVIAEHGLDAQSAVLALTHDPNLDDEAVLEALPASCFYVGALGSKRNYERRCHRLSSLLEPDELARLKSPVGLDIGSRSSAEIAISIVAELVQARALITRNRR